MTPRPFSSEVDPPPGRNWIPLAVATILVAAVVAALYRSKLVRAKSRFLESVRREWQEDRVLFERVLSDED